MAKKTNFIGIINEEIFHDVNSYNQRMTELINSGFSKIQATSSTSIVNECDNCGELTDNCTCDKVYECKDEPPINMLPGFNPRSNTSYLEELVTNNKYEDKIKLENVKNYQSTMFPLIVDKIQKMDSVAVRQYLQEINEVLDEIDGNSAMIHEEISKEQQAIQNHQETMDELQRALPVQEVIGGFYHNLKLEVEKQLNNVNNTKVSDASNCKSDGDGIDKLIEWIFGNDKSYS